MFLMHVLVESSIYFIIIVAEFREISCNSIFRSLYFEFTFESNMISALLEDLKCQ